MLNFPTVTGNNPFPAIAQADTIYKYIMHQKEHHKKLSFKEEYPEMLRKNDIDFDDKYLFEWLD
jgi:putative transposase